LYQLNKIKKMIRLAFKKRREKKYGTPRLALSLFNKRNIIKLQSLIRGWLSRCRTDTTFLSFLK